MRLFIELQNLFSVSAHLLYASLPKTNLQDYLKNKQRKRYLCGEQKKTFWWAFLSNEIKTQRKPAGIDTILTT